MRFFCVLCFSLFSLSVFPATVTVSMVQNPAAPPVALEMTRVIEDQIMNDYFGSGEIISNLEILENGLPSSRKNDSRIKKAAEGMSDFLLSVYAEYDSEERRLVESGEAYAALKKLEWQLIDVPSAKTLGRGSLAIKESEMQGNNPYGRARAVAGRISRESLKVQREVERRKK